MAKPVWSKFLNLDLCLLFWSDSGLWKDGWVQNGAELVLLFPQLESLVFAWGEQTSDLSLREEWKRQEMSDLN